MRLRLAPVYEDLQERKRSAKKLARLNFETACFGHGGTILSEASERFRKAFRTASMAMG